MFQQSKNRAAALVVLALLLSALPSVSWAQQDQTADTTTGWLERLEKLQRQVEADAAAAKQAAATPPIIQPAPVQAAPGAVSGRDALPDAADASLPPAAPRLTSPFAGRTSNYFDRPLDARLRLGGAFTSVERFDVQRMDDKELTLHQREGNNMPWELMFPAGDQNYLTLNGESRREVVEPDTGAGQGRHYEQRLTVGGLAWERGLPWGPSLYVAGREVYADGKAGRPDQQSAEFNGELRHGWGLWSQFVTLELRPGYGQSTLKWRGPTATVIAGLHWQRWDLEAAASWSRWELSLPAGQTANRTTQAATLTLRWHVSQRLDLALNGGITVVDWDDDRDGNFTQRETGSGPAGLSSCGLTIGYRF